MKDIGLNHFLVKNSHDNTIATTTKDAWQVYREIFKRTEALSHPWDLLFAEISGRSRGRKPDVF